ncbi:MAG: HD domain-containing protein [Planctomycetes bacterium]|nr:HD domain-containing protein [Planctomycetota bacterium]
MASAVLTQPTQAATTYTAVPLVGLVNGDQIPFPLYLRTADNVWVLYRPAAAALDESHLGRLHAEGLHQLFIRDEDRAAYFTRVESALDRLLLDRTMPLERRAGVLHGVAAQVAEDLLAAMPDRDTLQRAHRVMMATSGLLLRETQGFAAVRRVMNASHGLATHSLTVSFLSMGLARTALGADAGTLLVAGLAGLLHDVGRIGHEALDHDPEHAARGAGYLRALEVPSAIVEVARSHHERADGQGFPQQLRGNQIPELARIVGLCDQFDEIYSAPQPRVGVFDALRVLAQLYRGCFDPRLSEGLVRLFR